MRMTAGVMTYDKCNFSMKSVNKNIKNKKTYSSLLTYVNKGCS